MTHIVEKISTAEEKFQLSKDDVERLSEDGLCELQDKCAEIEVEAIVSAGDEGELSADAKTWLYGYKACTKDHNSG